MYLISISETSSCCSRKHWTLSVEAIVTLIAIARVKNVASFKYFLGFCDDKICILRIIHAILVRVGYLLLCSLQHALNHAVNETLCTVVPWISYNRSAEIVNEQPVGLLSVMRLRGDFYSGLYIIAKKKAPSFLFYEYYLRWNLKMQYNTHL